MMLKRFFLSLALAAGLLSPALGYGTIPYSLTQQFDSTGTPLIGGKLYLIQAGTTATPQSCYQDTALTLAYPNPITLDSAGRIPQLFCADGSIKVRLTDVNGVTQVVADNILVVGPSGGGGGGSTVDPTTILATGDLKVTYGTGSISGFVRANGRTIGSATSGASERANLDCQALFVYLWGADANLVVSTGRGVSGAADFAANKTIALPDWRGRALAGLDDMGNSAAGRLTATYFGAVTGALGTTLGAAGGGESKTLLTANLPPYTPSGTNGEASNVATWDGTVIQEGSVAGTVFAYPDANHMSHGANAFTGTAQGGLSTPVAVASPMMLATVYLKL